MFLPRLFSFLAILFIFAAPLAISAHGFPPDRLVPICNTIKETVTVNGVQKETGKFADPCDFYALMHLVRHLIDFALFLVMPIAAILFAYAGWLYLASSVDPGKKSQAHKIFTSVLWGLLWTLGAWLIVKLISDALLQQAFIGLPG